MKKHLLSLSLLAAAVLPAADLLYYPMEQDENPIKNHGTAQLQPTAFMLKDTHFTPAVVGNGLRIYGMADGIYMSDPAASFKGAVTISMYFRPERLHERMTLCSFYTADEQFLALKVQNQRLHMLDWSDRKNRRTYPCGEALKVKEWYHVAWVMDGQNWQCYLNGQLVQKVAAKALPSSPQAKLFHIGNDFHSAVHQRDRFVGTLDEFRITEGVLSGDAITSAAAKISSAAPFRPAPLSVTTDVVPIKAGVDNASQSFVFNGQKEPLMIYCGGGFLPMAGYSFSTIDKMHEQGISVFRSGPSGGRDFCGSTWWQGIGKYDFEIVDRNIQFVFERNPEAKLILQVAACPPDWWGREFPEECTQDINGRVRQDYFASHSYSSEKWLKDQEEAWTALFEHMKKQPYYSRIIGFTVPSGRYGECIRYGYNSQLYGKELTDYSKPELLAYRRWLKNHYGTIENMQKAYKTGKVPASFDEVMIPTPAERLRADSCYFVDPVVDRGNVDYFLFVNDQQAQAVCAFTKMMRKLCGPDKVIGLYYGYVFEDAGGFGRAFASESGHFGLGKVLREAPVNFLVGPVGYNQRNLGSVGPTMSTPASIALHGKIWLDEADIRTSLNGRKAEYSGAANLSESQAVLWRTFSNALINRGSLWWFPIAGGQSFSHEKIWNDFGKMRREMIHTAANPTPVDRRQSIAVIMDTDSIHFRRFSYRDQVTGNLLTYSRDVFAKSGVQIDSYISDDLELIPDDYPVYIFLNSFYADSAKREVINRRFKKNGKVLVWTYGAGYFKNDQPADRMSVSPKNMTDLTGIQMDWVLKLSSFETVPVKGAPLTMPAQKFPHKINPGLVVNDPAAKSLAKFTNDPAMAGKTALALKEMPGWKSIYLGVPEFTPELVRAIAQYGGAHVYTDAKNVVVRPGNGHILIHSGHADNVNITLPQTAGKVTDVRSGKVIVRNSKKLTVPISKNDTVLLRIE